MDEIIVSPSILSADFANLERDIKKVEPFVKWLHIDVMDGHFVPNISIGVPVVKSVRKATDLFLDVHLMIENPEKYINAFIDAGADLITFHYEAAKENTKDVIDMIKKRGKMAGLSIKPKTSPDEIKDYIKFLDLILVMTVEPGFGGQKFMDDCAEKIKRINEFVKPKGIIAELNFAIDKARGKNPPIIQVDGGINDVTGKICKDYGATSLVAGNYIYKAQNIEEAIKKLA